MPLGLVACGTLGDLLARVEAASGPPGVAVLGAVNRQLPHLSDGTLRVIVEVAHPADQSLTYLACATAPVPLSVAQVADNTNNLSNLPIGWITVSDERTEVATRRDHQRPTAAYTGKTVTVRFVGTEDASLATSFVVDDTSLTTG